MGWLSEEVLGGARRKRQLQADNMAQNLMTKDLSPDVINQVVNDWVKTGDMKIPSYQTKALPYDPEVPEGRSTRAPVKFGKKKGLFTLDQGSGQITQEETPDDITDFEVKTVPPKKAAPGQGYTIYVNSQTGAEIRREKNNTGKDNVIRITPPSAGGKGGKDPQDELAKDVIKKYQAALLKGEDIPDESMDSVRSAADRLNLDLAEVQKDPGMLDTVLGAGADVANKVPGVKLSKPAPKFGGSAVRFKPKAGKPLTKQQAQQFLQKAGGDKGKARKLAADAGYTF